VTVSTSHLSIHAPIRRAQMWGMRWWLRAFPGRLEPGAATVIIAYWRTPKHLKVGLEQIRRHSDPSVLRRVIVVDNASGDGFAQTIEDDLVRVLQLPANLGHAVALDRASWEVRTEFTIALDSDAWPISDAWLARLLWPLSEGAAICGIRHGNHIHPSGLAIRTTTLRRMRLSFRERYPSGEMTWDAPDRGRRWWDVGERITWEIRRRGMRIHPLEPDAREGYVGATYGGVLYHQWYGSRLVAEPDRREFDGIPREVIERETDAWTARFAPDGLA
jgi:glycosyltransferase involved in cell wall biosynthesis